MPSRTASIAEAVKTALNAGSAASAFSQTFTAERVYDPQIDLEDAKALRVTVIPKLHDRERQLSRAGPDREVTIDVGIRKRLTATADPTSEEANAELDPLTQFAEEVADFFDTDTDLDVAGARWLRTKIEPIFSPSHLKDHRLFFSVVSVTFKLFD